MANKNDKVTGNVEGILRGLGDLVGRLNELAQTGEQLKRRGVFDVDKGVVKTPKRFMAFR